MALAQFFRDLPLPERLKDMGIDDNQLHQAADLAADVLEIGTCPRSAQSGDLLELMRSVY